MKKTIKRYRSFLITAAIMFLFTMVNYELGVKAIGITAHSFKEMLLVVPPVFVILGLLDVWVPREAMVRYMGEESGILGAVLAFIIGSAAAGPLYGAFPIAAVFMKKGVGFRNILIFLGAWSTTKIPMFLYETAALGLRFSLARLAINIPGILIIAYLLNRFTSEKEKEAIYAGAQEVD